MKNYISGKAFEEGLNQIICFQKRDKSKAKITFISIIEPHYEPGRISDLRKKYKLSQRGLANIVGVSVRTVEAWESNRSKPSGAANRLLYLIDNDAKLIERLVVEDKSNSHL